MKAAARDEAPVGPTGNYKRGIKIKRRTRKGTVSSIVRTSAPHSGLVEFGSQDRYLKSGKYVGKMPALGPMKKAVAAKGQQAIDAANQVTRDEIEAIRGR